MTAILQVYINRLTSKHVIPFFQNFHKMSSRRDNLKRKATAAAEVKAKRLKGETDLGDNLKWEHVGEIVKSVCPLIVLSSSTLPGRQKVAGFDIDFTVIKTASGRQCDKCCSQVGSRDWEWWDDSVPGKLKSLDKDGYRVIFFTNQAGIEKLKVTIDEITIKIENIIKELGIPVYAFICTGENQYRKPSTFMWDLFEKKYNQCVKVDRSASVYVGDAAGRPKEWAPGKPKDFSCSDRKFAANLGVKFATPEEFFLGESPVRFDWMSIDPSSIMKSEDASAKKKEYHSKPPEMIIMVGCPASGKSTFRKRYFEPHGYVAVNRDTMGTMQKCIKAATEALKSGKSVVADNTNPSASARKDFIDTAKKQGVPCRCFVMNTPVEIAHHLNYVRQTQTDGKVRRIPDVGYNVYKKNFEPPSKVEGFTEIVNIDFVPSFDSKTDKEIFQQWT